MWIIFIALYFCLWFNINEPVQTRSINLRRITLFLTDDEKKRRAELAARIRNENASRKMEMELQHRHNAERGGHYIDPTVSRTRRKEAVKQAIELAFATA